MARPSAPGADPFNPKTPQAITDLLLQSNPWVKGADTDHHGYGVVKATSTSLECRLRRISTAKRRTSVMLPDLKFTVQRGKPSLLG